MNYLGLLQVGAFRSFSKCNLKGGKTMKTKSNNCNNNNTRVLMRDGKNHFSNQHFHSTTMRKNEKDSNSFENKLENEYQFLKVEEDGGNKHRINVSINRKQVHNAFNEILIHELTKAFKAISQSNYRAVVITGTGNSFSAGADLNWMKKMANNPREQNEKDSLELFDMIYSIKTCPIPVIARINGPALGGGSGIVAACDMGYSVSTAKFGFTEVKIGLIPAVISPFVMEKIGKGNCSHYFLTGERFGAEEAKRMGLIQQHFETEEQMDSEVKRVTEEICSNGPKSMKLCKQLIRNISNMNYNDASTKVFVANEIASIRASEEGQIGLNAFLNKTKPNW
eukprot:TRINITY_DN6763_c1_g2_i1.p1 TRINITY_DN6763_c1_g2~~TRINITY_DN6763_c1_g2_i1.p1  ORF type:complete len:338 (+),score=110.87 TRINITY_DN6763_c1_g2_i1:161-1174(+)